MIRKFRAPLLALLTFVLLAASQSSATAYFTRGSGNWSGVSTWSTVACGGAAAASVPAAGDTVTLCDGNAVTVDANTAVGSSPADDTGTPAVKAQSTTGTGVLNIAAGVTFTFRGPVRQGNGHWTVAAGAQLIHDSSVQGGTASYSWRVGEANCTSTCATLTMTGAAGNRITVGIAGGSAAFAGFSCNSTSSCVNGQGQIRAQYVNINR